MALLESRRYWQCRYCATRVAITPLHTDRAELERVIDTCSTCDVVWLDPLELQRAAAPGADRRF
jgi:Zn-finger nucleic acid-binding protein